MPYILTRLQVEDQERWKSFFEENRPFRQEEGSRGGTVFASTENPNEVTVLLEWNSTEDARSFVESDELRERLNESGVQATPEFRIVEKLEDTQA